jgi:hypothetical protein
MIAVALWGAQLGGLVNGLPKGKLVLGGASTFIAVMGVVFLWRAII